MAVEFDPNEFRRQNFGSAPQQPQAPAPMQAPASIPPQATPMPVQGHPQPYAPQPPVPYQPQPQTHQQPAGHPAQYIPGQPHPAPQTDYSISPQGYPAQPQPYFESPATSESTATEKTSILSRFKRGSKDPKPSKAPKSQPATRSNVGFAKPFLAGLLSGIVMTIVGVSILGSMAKKSMENKIASVAASVEQSAEITEIAEHDLIAPEE